nr:MAG TPA: hypothetical protein [Caudoviricetes sp.]
MGGYKKGRCQKGIHPHRLVSWKILTTHDVIFICKHIIS